MLGKTAEQHNITCGGDGNAERVELLVGFLFEPSGDHPLWRSVPSWFIIGELDHNIPAGAQHVMAERAGSRRTIEIPGASHVVGVSRPGEVARVVLEAVADRAAVAG